MLEVCKWATVAASCFAACSLAWWRYAANRRWRTNPVAAAHRKWFETELLPMCRQRNVEARTELEADNTYRVVLYRVIYDAAGEELQGCSVTCYVRHDDVTGVAEFDPEMHLLVRTPETLVITRAMSDDCRRMRDKHYGRLVGEMNWKQSAATYMDLVDEAYIMSDALWRL
jgi:hypothetical protein